MLRVLISVAMSAFIGTYFWNIPETQTQELIGALMFITAFPVMLTIAAVISHITAFTTPHIYQVPIFLEERAIFVRERSNGAYRVSAWFMANTLASLIPMILTAILTTSAVYFSIGLNPEYYRYLYLILLMFSALLVS